jgi:serine protease DegS
VFGLILSGISLATVASSRAQQNTFSKIDEPIRDDHTIRGYIGITGRDIAPMHTQGSLIGRNQGIVVAEVSPDGPAAHAGIQINDVILSMNNKPAISAKETMSQVSEIPPGSEIPVVIMRNNKKLKLKVTVQGYSASNN